MAAPGSGAEDDDPQREARAYNANIYLMVSAPYVLLAFFCLLIYRGFKKIQRAEAARAAADSAALPGGRTAPETPCV